MRVRVVRTPAALSSTVVLDVQRWCGGQWEHVMNFELHESEQATEFAMKLSMSKRFPVELAVFEDGQKLDQPHLEPLFIAAASTGGEKLSENSP